MSTRKIKDAVDLSTGEKVYYKSHAKATYMSDGRTVEDAIKTAGGGGGSEELSEIMTSIENINTEIENINTAIEGRPELKYVVRDTSPVNLASAAVNTCYVYTGVAGNMKISKFGTPSGIECRYAFRFRGATSLTIPSSVIWVNGSIPDIDSSAHYELSVVATQTADGYVYKAVLGKFLEL